MTIMEGVLCYLRHGSTSEYLICLCYEGWVHRAPFILANAKFILFFGEIYAPHFKRLGALFNRSLQILHEHIYLIKIM